MFPLLIPLPQPSCFGLQPDLKMGLQIFSCPQYFLSLDPLVGQAGFERCVPLNPMSCPELAGFPVIPAVCSLDPSGCVSFCGQGLCFKPVNSTFWVFLRGHIGCRREKVEIFSRGTAARSAGWLVHSHCFSRGVVLRTLVVAAAHLAKALRWSLPAALAGQPGVLQLRTQRCCQPGQGLGAE